MKKNVVALLAWMTFLLPSALTFALDETTVTNATPAFQALPAEVQAQVKKAIQGGATAKESGGIEKLLPADPGPQPTSADAAAGTGDNAIDPGKKSAENQEAPGRDQAHYSKIEQRYRQGYASTLSGEVRQFGYDFFASKSTRPSQLAVPHDDYLIGPGDKLRIRIWGAEIDAEFIGAVARDGSINVPRIGIVPVAGVRMGDVAPVIRKEAEKYVQGININVSLEELRSVEVYVVGAVGSPGLHMVPAFSTVLGGLLAGGGVQKNGSLRAIELYRDGRLFKKIDLYALLLKGKRDFDVLLTDRDVVFVPRLGKTVAVVGAVSEEAIFELRDEKTVGALFDLAGGILPQGATGRMYLRRYLHNQEFTVQDIATQEDEAGQWKALAVQDGDLLELQFLAPTWPRVVRLEGHVWNPDVFQYREGLALSDILVSADLLQPDSVTDFALLYSYDAVSTRFQVQRFPLAKVLAHQYDAKLKPYDRIVILSRQETGIREEFSVHGAVWKGGSFAFQPGLTLADAIALAGGEKFGARRQGVELSRQEVQNEEVVTRQTLLSMDQDAGLVLQPYDDVYIPLVKDATVQRKVTISGQVKFPGSYVVQKGDHISDVILRAGGFLDDAYYYGAEYTSEKARAIQQQSIDRMVQELEIKAQQVTSTQAQTSIGAEEVAGVKAAEAAIGALLGQLKAVRAKGRVTLQLAGMTSFRGSAYDFVVEDGDTLHIPARPSFVATVGSVYSPSAYLYEPDMDMAYYLDKSGGPTKEADEKYIYLLKANGEVVSKARSHAVFSSFNSLKLMPGDTIVVPADLERLPYLRLIRDVSDIVFKIATTAGVAIAVM